MVSHSSIEGLRAWVKKNGAWNNSHTIYICETCGESFSKPPSAKSKFCSKKCFSEAMRTWRGSKAANWRGGKHKCVDCKKEISYTAERCKKCAAVLMPHMHIKDRPWLRTKEVIRKCLRRHPISSLEIKFQGIIDKNNLPYKYVGNGKFFIGRKIPDFINAEGKKIAVEVYARKHKEKMRNITIEQWKKDRKEFFSRYGWETIFFDEVQLTEENVLSTLKGGVSYF